MEPSAFSLRNAQDQRFSKCLFPRHTKGYTIISRHTWIHICAKYFITLETFLFVFTNAKYNLTRNYIIIVVLLYS